MTTRIGSVSAMALVGPAPQIQVSYVSAMALVGAPTLVDTGQACLSDVSVMALVGESPRVRLSNVTAMLLRGDKSIVAASATGHHLQQQTF